jgi:hypothetical protein
MAMFNSFLYVYQRVYEMMIQIKNYWLTSGNWYA